MAAGGEPERRHRLVYHALAERLEHLVAEVLDAIRASLRLDPVADRRAAIRLSELLADAEAEGRLLGLDELAAMVEGETVTIVGGAYSPLPSLEGVVVAADGAVARLVWELGTCPDIIFTDLDGPLEALLACRHKSIYVVHAHGDNPWLLDYTVPLLPRVAGTVQVYPPPPHTSLALGFTDGDRALLTVVALGASRVRLACWGPGLPQHPATKRLPNPLKPAKLRIAEDLVRLARLLCEELHCRLEDTMGGDGLR